MTDRERRRMCPPTGKKKRHTAHTAYRFLTASLPVCVCAVAADLLGEPGTEKMIVAGGESMEKIHV